MNVCLVPPADFCISDKRGPSCKLGLPGLRQQQSHQSSCEQQGRHQQDGNSAVRVHQLPKDYITHYCCHSAHSGEEPQGWGPESRSAMSSCDFQDAHTLHSPTLKNLNCCFFRLEASYRSWVGYSSVPTTSRAFQAITETPLKTHERTRLWALVWTM